MKISCVHCGNEFSITAEQLGTRGKCPHCAATILLPKADTLGDESQELEKPSNWLENSMSGVGAIILHLLAVIVLAMIPWGDIYDGNQGEGEEVVIGQLAKQELTDFDDQQLRPEQLETQDQSKSLNALNEEITPPSTTDPLAEQEFDVNIMSPSGGRQSDLDLHTVRRVPMDSTGGEDFGQLISRLKRDGLDIVITFDSTGSMQGEIQEVKHKIQRIGTALMKLVPKTRISICTYRDKGDRYLVKGLPLTNNLAEIITYLDDIQAGGGGDEPEAVDAGLSWAITKNPFRRRARKVILLFGDAPPHRNEKSRCLKLVSNFRRQYNGIVSTVTCRSDERLPEFIEIAQMGGGEAFLTREDREIMTQLVVLVFGSKHREKVLQAFEFLK